MLTIYNVDHVTDDTKIMLQTAVKNSEDSYFDLCELKEYTGDEGDIQKFYYYFAGPGAGNVASVYPGFGRYLRIAVKQGAAANCIIALDAIMKP